MIEVIKPGIYTTVQDLGRTGVAHLGIPPSGAMDRRAAIFANRLVSNHDKSALLECTLRGPELLFHSDATIAVTGAIVQPFVNETPILMHRSIRIRKGERLHFGRIVNGVRYYISISGGLDTPIIWGSQSACITSSISDLIQVGQYICVHPPTKADPVLPHTAPLGSKNIEAIRGPEFDLIAKKLENLLYRLESPLRVLPESNRMAVRVSHHQNLTHTTSILSSGTVPGTVQLTPRGDIILLMRDCQTTGGYPRVLQLNEQSICQLSQLQAGTKFSLVIKQ